MHNPPSSSPSSDRMDVDLTPLQFNIATDNNSSIPAAVSDFTSPSPSLFAFVQPIPKQSSGAAVDVSNTPDDNGHNSIPVQQNAPIDTNIAFASFSLSSLPALSTLSVDEVQLIEEEVRRHVSPLLEELRAVRQQRITVSNISEYYLKKLAAALDASKSLRREAHSTNEGGIATLESGESGSGMGSKYSNSTTATVVAEYKKRSKELELRVVTLDKEATLLRDDKVALTERLAERDASIAADARELASLRGDAAALPGVRARLSAAEAARVQAEAACEEVEQRSSVRLQTESSAARALEAEVTKLTTALAKARSDADAAARQTAEEMAVLNGEKRQMQQRLDRLTREGAETKDAAKQLDESFRSEVERLVAMCDVDEQRASEADDRARDWKEALEQQKDVAARNQERLSNLRKAVKSQGALAAHVGVANEGINKI